jgi:acyl-[acyl-carrier-protein] desaturase
MYSANLLMLTGFALTSGSLWLVLIFATMCTYFVASANFEEAALQRALPGYTTRMLATGKFLPRLYRRSRPNEGPEEENRRSNTSNAQTRQAIPLLTSEAKSLAIERGIVNLYRWYTQQSQRHRNWHADTCVDWRGLRSDHPDPTHTIVEGFFAVEQYTPDYVVPLLGLLRKSYGRSQWHIRWGAEEERHADLWRNATVALGRRNESWIEEYSDSLRSKPWSLPWDSPLHMVFYQVIQERATYVSYRNFGLAVSGMLPLLPSPVDPVMIQICRLIAHDEAAHYHFFTEVARLLIYYQTEKALDAFADVLRLFTMPARNIVPGYEKFGQALHDTGIFGRTIYYHDVVQVVLEALSLPPLRALERCVHQAREISTNDKARRATVFMEAVDLNGLETKVRRTHRRNQAHLEQVGLDRFFQADWRPAWKIEEVS